MRVIFIKDREYAGKLRRPGELLDVPDKDGRELIAAGDARERKATGPAETKEAS